MQPTLQELLFRSAVKKEPAMDPIVTKELHSDVEGLETPPPKGATDVLRSTKKTKAKASGLALLRTAGRHLQ